MKIRVGAAYYVLLCFCVRNQYAITLYAGYVIYDDACHLKKFATNKSRSTQTETSQRIALMKMVVDRFHFPGHVDSWCKKHCNPNDIDELKGVRQFKHTVWRETLANLANHPGFAKLKPSKLVLIINNLLADLLISQTFFCQMLKTSQTFPPYGTYICGLF